LEAFAVQHTGTKFSADLFYQRLMSFPKRRPAMTVVQIEKPEDANLADWFAELRSWFDVNDCSPLLFRQSRDGNEQGPL
jgi:predicted alpha/beta hydrolase family esterase